MAHTEIQVENITKADLIRQARKDINDVNELLRNAMKAGRTLEEQELRRKRSELNETLDNLLVG